MVFTKATSINDQGGVGSNFQNYSFSENAFCLKKADSGSDSRLQKAKNWSLLEPPFGYHQYFATWC